MYHDTFNGRRGINYKGHRRERNSRGGKRILEATSTVVVVCFVPTKSDVVDGALKKFLLVMFDECTVLSSSAWQKFATISFIFSVRSTPCERQDELEQCKEILLVIWARLIQISSRNENSVTQTSPPSHNRGALIWIGLFKPILEEPAAVRR